jgi:hypothetical protein
MQKIISLDKFPVLKLFEIDVLSFLLDRHIEMTKKKPTAIKKDNATVLVAPYGLSIEFTEKMIGALCGKVSTKTSMELLVGYQEWSTKNKL